MGDPVSGVLPKVTVTASTAYTTPNDILATTLSLSAIAPTFQAGVLMISVTVDASARLDLMEDGVARETRTLTANDFEELSFLVAEGRTYDFQLSANCNILRFLVVETSNVAAGLGPKSQAAAATIVGDVSVNPVTPGVGALNLGKAEDAVAGDGDTGVLMLGVRRDAAASSAGTDGDYATLNLDATGNLRTTASLGSALGGGTEAAALRVTVANDSTGVLTVDDGGSTISVDDGGVPLSVDDGGGSLTVDDGGGALTVDGSVGVLTVPADPFGVNADAAVAAGAAGSIQAKLRRLTADLGGVLTSVQLIDNAISGNEMQVDLVIAGHDESPALDLAVQTAAYGAEDSLLSGAHSMQLARTSGIGAILNGFSIVDNIGSASEAPELHILVFASSVLSAPGANVTMSATGGPVLNDSDLDNLLTIQTITTGNYEQLGEDAFSRTGQDPVSLPPPNTGADYGIVVKTGTALTAVASRSMRLRAHVSQD